jgi:hypothetical protein
VIERFSIEMTTKTRGNSFIPTHFSLKCHGFLGNESNTGQGSQAPEEQLPGVEQPKVVPPKKFSIENATDQG